WLCSAAYLAETLRLITESCQDKCAVRESKAGSFRAALKTTNLSPRGVAEMARRVDTKSIRIPDDGEADKYWAASSRKTGSPIVNSECPLPHIKIYSKA